MPHNLLGEITPSMTHPDRGVLPHDKTPDTHKWEIVGNEGGDGSQIALTPSDIDHPGLYVSLDVHAVQEIGNGLTTRDLEPGIVDMVNALTHLSPGNSEISPLIISAVLGGIAAREANKLSGQFLSHLFNTDMTYITGAGAVGSTVLSALWWFIADVKEDRRKDRVKAYENRQAEIFARLGASSVFIPDTGVNISGTPRRPDGSRGKDQLVEWSGASSSGNNKEFKLGEFVKKMLEKHPSPGSFWMEIVPDIQRIIENSHTPEEVDPEENRAILEQIEAEAVSRREEVDTFAKFQKLYANLQNAIHQNEVRPSIRDLLFAVSEEIRVSGGREGEVLTVASLKKANALMTSLQRQLPDLVSGDKLSEKVYPRLIQSIGWGDTGNLHLPLEYAKFLSEPREIAAKSIV